MKKEIKLKQGDFVLYHDNTLMEKTEVVNIDKKQGSAILANKVTITRTTDINGRFNRLDGKGSAIITPWDDKTEKRYDCYKSYHSCKKNLEELKKYLDNSGPFPEEEENQDVIINMSKKLNRIIEKTC